jgi:hypothetical protein
VDRTVYGCPREHQQGIRNTVPQWGQWQKTRNELRAYVELHAYKKFTPQFMGPPLATSVLAVPDTGRAHNAITRVTCQNI